jgi:outer membrane protein TolC
LIQLLAQWQSARARADRYEHEWLPLSEERNAAALAAYRGGAGRLQDVLDALDTAVEHQIAYIDVRETLGQAWSTLQYAFPEEP